jgi:hypothetical protein
VRSKIPIAFWLASEASDPVPETTNCGSAAERSWT